MYRAESQGRGCCEPTVVLNFKIKTWMSSELSDLGQYVTGIQSKILLPPVLSKIIRWTAAWRTWPPPGAPQVAQRPRPRELRDVCNSIWNQHMTTGPFTRKRATQCEFGVLLFFCIQAST